METRRRGYHLISKEKRARVRPGKNERFSYNIICLTGTIIHSLLSSVKIQRPLITKSTTKKHYQPHGRLCRSNIPGSKCRKHEGEMKNLRIRNIIHWLTDAGGSFRADYYTFSPCGKLSMMLYVKYSSIEDFIAGHLIMKLRVYSDFCCEAVSGSDKAGLCRISGQTAFESYRHRHEDNQSYSRFIFDHSMIMKNSKIGSERMTEYSHRIKTKSSYPTSTINLTTS